MLPSQHMGSRWEIPGSPRFLPACFLSSPFSLLALQSMYSEHHLLPADSGWGNAPHPPLLPLMPVALHFQLVIITLMAHNHSNDHFLKTKGQRCSPGSASLQSGGLGRTALVYLRLRSLWDVPAHGCLWVQLHPIHLPGPPALSG